MKIIDQLFRSNIFNSTGPQATRQQTAQSAGDPFGALKNSEVPGMDKVEKLLRKMDHPVSDSETASIERFMKDGSGTSESKLETIEWAADKGIEMTDKNLNAIHETLNADKAEAEMIQKLTGTESASSDQAEEIMEKIKADPTIPDALKASIEEAVKSGLPLEKAIVRAVKNLLRANVEVKGQVVFMQNGQNKDSCVCISLSDVLMAVEKALDEIANGQGTFEDALKEALLDVLGEDQIQTLGDILSDDGDGKAIKAEGAASEDDEKTLDDEDIDDFEKDMLERLEASFDDVMASFMESADAETASAISDIRFKSFLVTKVTAQAIEAKETFNQVKKDIVQSLRDIERPKTEQEKIDVKEVLNKAIEKLDNMLMKSDVTLFTTMRMERDLLNMSSTLQEARKLLAKGDVDGALDITKNVQGKLDQMIFKPSEKNIQLMAYKEGVNILDLKQSMAPSINWQDASARGVLELFRNMGLNHEPEVAEKLLGSGKNLEKDDDYKIKDNLKAVLLKMIEAEEQNDKRTVTATERSLNNLTGQQLMNKLETKQDTQTLFFHVPVEADGEIKDMKLYVNARKNGDALDWENSSLYFSIELKKYGETGIHLQAKDRLLSISVRNDNASFENAMKPLVRALQKEFVDVGYKLGPVSFMGLENKSPREIVKPGDIESQPTTKRAQAPSEKGFDFSI